MATRKQQVQLGHEVAQYFTHRPGTEFVGFAGLGRHGGALLLEEKDDQGRLLRKLVIKYSLGALTNDVNSNADEDLRNEYRWLEMLTGAEHIVRLIPFADCSLNLPGITDGEDTYIDSLENMSIKDEAQKNEGETSERGAKLTKEPSRVRKCPTFALEYLPNGTFYRLILRLQSHPHLIPNRVMWRIWLCLVRQCVAMAFPPLQSLENYSPKRERINANTEYFTLTQNSSHVENFVFAEASVLHPDEDHDPGVPPVKLIDFGRGRLEDPLEYTESALDNPYECGAQLNLWGAASAMGQLACPLADEDEIDSDHEISYVYFKDGTMYRVMTSAFPALTENYEMDRPLRDVLVRCMALDIADAPSLEEVLAQAEDKVANRGPDDDQYLAEQMGLLETDDYIREFVQRFLYDASA